MKITLIVILMTILMCSTSETQKLDYPKAKVSYSDFENLVDVVKSHREKRLISFDDFLAKKQRPKYRNS